MLKMLVLRQTFVNILWLDQNVVKIVDIEVKFGQNVGFQVQIVQHFWFL